MYLMELIIKTAKTKSRDLIAIAVNAIVIILFYYLLIEDSEIIYPLMLSGFIMFVYFAMEVMKYKRFEERLQDSKNSPNYDSTGTSFGEEEILRVISELHDEYLKRIYDLSQQIDEREALFSQWIHNMKTSVTVIDLACGQSEEKGEALSYIEDIREENNTLKKNLEQCLNVLRLDDFSRDYVTNSFNLKELVNGAVKIKKRDFIYNKVFPKVSIEENLLVYTDKKWCTYLLEQIISNAIKYSNGSKEIFIWAEEIKDEINLYIKDYGLGISKEDLARIYEPFFTGENGRQDRSATGIGLYMVKLISKKLGHKVQLDSKAGEGTVVRITFHKQIII